MYRNIFFLFICNIVDLVQAGNHPPRSGPGTIKIPYTKTWIHIILQVLIGQGYFYNP